MDKLRKFVWVLVFAGILINGAALVIPNVPKQVKFNSALFGLFQCFYCYITFDNIWIKKEEKKNEG